MNSRALPPLRIRLAAERGIPSCPCAHGSPGKHILESDAQQALQFAVLEFHIGGHRRDQFDQLVIKERHARLDAVRHAHPVFYLQHRLAAAS